MNVAVTPVHRLALMIGNKQLPSMSKHKPGH